MSSDWNGYHVYDILQWKKYAFSIEKHLNNHKDAAVLPG